VAIEVRLLGGFGVRRDGVALPPFPRRDAALLVKLLALTPGHRLPGERAADLLWPNVGREEARPRLHKAAHYARRALGSPDGVVLRDNCVSLFPGREVQVDVERFEAAAALALDREDRVACAAAAALCGGDLLPEDTFEPWTDEPRERVRRRRSAVLRAAGRWEEVLELEPADEAAHLALLRAAVDAGDRGAALRRYERMARALSDELGVDPGQEAVALRARVLSVAPPAAPRPGSGDGPPLLERDTQLEQLEGVVGEAVGTGRGVVVLVTGEAGAGKTALVRTLLDRAAASATVLYGGCDDLLAPRSMGPFRDIAQALPGELSDAFAAGGDPDLVLAALLRLVSGAPVLLAIEDVHWADDATVDAVRYLARRIGGTSSVLLLTCREDELGRGHPLRKLLGSLPGTLLHRVPVPPLSLQAVTALAGGRTDAQRLHRITRGNAFYVTEVLAAGDTGGTGVPATVRDAVLARLAGLSPEAQDVVSRLAVIPSRAERPVAEQLSGGRLPALLEAERAGVVAGDPGHVWFRHEIARAAVLSTLTPGELVAAHREVLGALLVQRDPHLARVVHHARAARRTDVLLEHGPAAAAEAARAGAHRQSAETLRVVLEAGTGLGHARRARLLTDLAYSLYYLNRFEEAFGTATHAVREAEPTGDPLVLADALSVLSKAGFWARGPLTARRAAHRAVDLLENAGDEVRLAVALADLARAYSNLATLGIVAEPGTEATRFGQRALSLADRLDRDDLRCQALFYLGSSRLADGNEQGAADLDRSIALASHVPHLELKVRACVNAAGSAYRAGRFPDAERYVTLGLRLAENGEFFGGEYRLRLTRAGVRASSGRWDDAIGELRDLLAVPGDPAAMGHLARALLSRLLARRGDPDAAGVLAGASSGPPARDDPFIGGPLAAADVELAWLRRDTDAMPALAADALRHAAVAGHRGSAAELCRYLQRAGHAVDRPAHPIGPWAPGLAGRPLAAAAGWAELGERYEEAVELALSDDPAGRDRGLRGLDELGAVATLALLRGGPLSLPHRRAGAARR
jgi:DNA-binding SARP family transcriptional activator/tetratricopeptide (TPR) repeat protein